jgi:hypothetical protein
MVNGFRQWSSQDNELAAVYRLNYRQASIAVSVRHSRMACVAIGLGRVHWASFAEIWKEKPEKAPPS